MQKVLIGQILLYAVASAFWKVDFYRLVTLIKGVSYKLDPMYLKIWIESLKHLVFTINIQSVAIYNTMTK